MKYFVIWPDGQRFGPVDISTLHQWQAENRIDGETVLEEERSHQRVRAALVIGGQQTVVPNAVYMPPQTGQTPFGAPQQPYIGYPRGGQYAPQVAPTNGKTELTLSYVFGAASILLALCIPCIFPIVGVVLGFIAKSKGQRAGGAIALNIVSLVIQIALTLTGFLGSF